ncbi:oligosaccharide flippase family protein [Algoriphagus sp. D3-2-R+10]|uniref:oligosaccharide flippase family protein n=1 Tax=Algoriphagus aurantiacus TaxID=3103948 RepID=UPI002B38E69F|nr:oligosaccharide flippase family protein [Algoriphagus sp. D3-2-R+10]MEB2777515.1 oligosaccharide flippase family protein [Algoriphagus sp. D3-2-R+10]
MASTNVVSAAKSVLIGSFISKGISFLSSIILARILLPDDYGSLILATIITGLIGQIGSMGFELYYLQYKGSDSEKLFVLNQVYILRLITNSIIFLVQSLLGLYLIFFMESEVSGGIIIMLAVSLLIEAFNSPQEAILKDKIDFKRITVGNIYREVFGTIAKISAAFLGLGGLSFGFGPIIGSLTRLIYYRNIVSYKLDDFQLDKNKISEIFKFGKHLLFASIGSYFVQQIDKIIITSFFSKEDAGKYSFSWNIAAMPFNYLIVPQAQLNLSYITKFKQGDFSLFEKLSIVQKMIFTFFFPVILFLILFVEEGIVLLFTEKWIDTTPIVSILLVYYTFQSITFPFSGVINGLGRPEINSKIIIIRFCVLVPALLIAVFYFPGMLIYTYIFVLISLIFDFLKMIFSFKLIDGLNKQAIGRLWIELLFFFLILIVSFINFDSSIFKILTFFGLNFLFISLSLVFNRQMFFESFLLFKRSIISKI